MHVFCDRCGAADSPQQSIGMYAYELPKDWVNFKFAANPVTLLCAGCYGAVVDAVTRILKPIRGRK